MIDYFYYQGTKTKLLPGDVIKWSPDHHKLTFYRGDVRLLIGGAKDDSLVEHDTVKFLFILALATGLEPVPSNEYTHWVLTDK